MPNTVEEEIRELKPGEIFVLQTPVENSIHANITAVKTLQSAGYSGVYITFFKDYLELAKLMKDGGVDVSQLAFVDGVTKLYGLSQALEKNIEYIDGPLSLDVTLDTVTKMLAFTPGDKKFIFLDSLTVVLLYNSLSRTEEFVRSLSELIKKANYAGVFSLASRGIPNEALVNELKQTSDRLIILP